MHPAQTVPSDGQNAVQIHGCYGSTILRDVGEVGDGETFGFTDTTEAVGARA